MHARRNSNSGADYYHSRTAAQLAAYLDSQYGIEPGSPAHLAAIAAIGHVNAGRPDEPTRTGNGICVTASAIVSCLRLDRFIDGSDSVVFLSGWLADK